jgi:hypothetical protein
MSVLFYNSTTLSTTAAMLLLSPMHRTRDGGKPTQHLSWWLLRPLLMGTHKQDMLTVPEKQPIQLQKDQLRVIAHSTDKLVSANDRNILTIYFVLISRKHAEDTNVPCILWQCLPLCYHIAYLLSCTCITDDLILCQLLPHLLKGC